jgi:protein-S-isoprenylcysteine O-methyltransferase Ste14
MLALFRALVYASLFVGFFLVFVPERILAAGGIVRPENMGPLQVAGLIVLSLGGALALWCVVTLALVGKGTPAPFDPPRKLVVKGPYRWVRNPMYIGAGFVLVGTALYFRSLGLAAFAAAFWTVAHLFVVFYEEIKLERTFGALYADYRNAVGRWVPKWRS